MCKKCLEAVKKHFPELPESDYGHLLMGATCYPFCGPDLLESQLIELKENTDGSVEAMLCYAEIQMEEEYKKYKQSASDQEG